MITTLGRILTILVAMGSVAFMAFAISRWATIPDWAAEADSLSEFRLTRTEGETPSWSAVTVNREEPVGTSTNIGELLEKMYQRATQDAQEEFRAYSAEIPILESQIEEAKTTIAADSIGVQNRADELVLALNTIQEAVDQMTQQAEEQKAEAHRLQQERERRRSDVFRLQEELVEVRADSFRAEQLQKELTDMIRLLEGSVVKLQTRQEQLQKSLQ